ncbi:unnamed protein product [Arabis nemorensis]|uniref:COPA/B second beta-propeller domain-containing protein n=1 Tax=Arabis nemorensis TaxID=586526 RepID=A0A565BUQ2_9BRAS|nr:unnamed protein product [Arabis nemorensis]
MVSVVSRLSLWESTSGVVSGCCDGSLYIWDYNKGIDIKYTKGAAFVQVWSAKFVARKQWVVTGTDESFIRVYDYHDTTKLLLMDEIRAFKAHSGPINCVAVHPTLPYVLSASDDKLINLWNWEQDWLCMQTFTSHTYFVMYVTFNPKDTNTFATASLDKTVKIWNLEDPKPISTFDAHQGSGVNCLDFYPGEEDKPYLITGSDDYTAKFVQLFINLFWKQVWNYQTSKCVMTLQGHTNSVRAVCFHPTLPIIITGSNDKTLRIWHATTFRLENTVDLRIRVHAIGHRKGSCRIVYGCDHGPGMVKLMHELPVASMGNQGNVILAKHNDIHSGIIKLISGKDGILDINGKLGTCSFYPEFDRLVVLLGTTTSLKHSPDGCFVAVLGNCEYIIYDACTWEKILSGSALEFVWSSEGEYAVKVSSSQIKIFSNKFQETGGLAFSAEYIFGGTLLGMCTNDSVFFFAWAKCRFISKIDFPVKNLYWANSGDRVAIVSDSSFKIFKFDRDSVSSYLDGGKTIGEKGIVGAFEILNETKECVRSGLWVMDCFIFYADSWKLKYCVGCEVTTMDWLSGSWSVLCYLSDRVCLIDNKFKITTYTLPLSLIKFKTCIVRGDREQARSIFHTIPEEHHSSLACFLIAQ